MADDDPTSQAVEFDRKARFDLWTHQNLLFWDRFKVLGIIQAAYFTALNAIRGDLFLMYCALIVTGIVTVILLNIVPGQKITPWLAWALGMSADKYEQLFQTFVFVLFWVVDIAVIWHFTSGGVGNSS